MCSQAFRPPSEPAPSIRGLLLQPGGTCVRYAELADSNRVTLVYSGRYAIYHALRVLGSRERRTVLVPAFQCPTVVDPVLHAGYDVRFYAVTRGLVPDAQDLRAKLTPDVGAVLFIRYFGFPSGVDEHLSVCREQGVLTIDDWSHSFLEAAPTSLPRSAADVRVFSFKKTVPSLTGGGLLANRSILTDDELSRPALRNSLARFKRLSALRRDRFRANDTARTLDPQSREGEARLAKSTPAIKRTADDAYPYGPELAWTGIPFASRTVLTRTCLEQVVNARRRNYLVLEKILSGCRGLRLAQEFLPERTCPWGLPVVIENRGAHDHRLRTLGVPLFTFGEVLHPLVQKNAGTDSTMVETAQSLSDSLLVFAIHQDLDDAFVAQYGNVIRAYFESISQSSKG